jgi:tRNA1Val (adenine37-N6)-methyltransferase
LIQPRRGNRFSVDSILLGRFIRPRRGDRILELGAGCGVISVMAAMLYEPRAVIAVEIQDEMVEFARRNADANALAQMRVIAADIRARAIDGLDGAGFDLVIANPPYRTGGSGRRSPDRSRDLARAESAATLSDFIGAAARYLKHGGRAAFVFAADRAAELISELRSARLEPKRIRMVHPRIDLPATTILAEARKGGGVELQIEPPLILYAAPGVYSEQAKALLGS